ncbi:MAG: hypothetical protein IBJ17_14270 [Reyranella sp.]|nr:hypothetical protein [Reyranella sp.]
MTTRLSRRRDGPLGALAWQKYRVELTSGRAVTLLFSLADPADPTIAGIKERHAAANLGLLAVLDDPESPEEAVLWLHQETTLALVSHNGDTIIGEEVRALLPAYFADFFREVEHLAPGLSGVTLVAPCAARKRLH